MLMNSIVVPGVTVKVDGLKFRDELAPTPAGR